MESPVNGSAKNSPTYPSKDARAFDDLSLRSGSSAAAEVLRLQNVLRCKDKEIEGVRKEVATLKASLHHKDRSLQQRDQDLRLVKERYAGTEGDLASVTKELAAVKVEKRKLEAQLGGLARKGDKEQPLTVLVSAAPVVANTIGSPPGGDQAVTLQSDPRSPKLDGEKAVESIRVLENLLRSKDKQIHSMQRKLEDVEVYKTKCADLENRVSDLLRQLDNERASCRTSADVLRMSDSEKAKLAGDLLKVRAQLETAQEAAARSNAALKASETRCTALEAEVGVLTGQLARIQAVANRVAVSEVKAGCKDEGMVHVTRHLEEVRFMSGEILRLQQRVTALEKELAVADELKVRGAMYWRANGSYGGS
ncbi:hypothetical protein Vretifemale_2245 [Volvox reticuliferus]|nr:hypothetical protein Vretifemale_2245 [Volvox reticuliferus]